MLPVEVEIKEKMTVALQEVVMSNGTVILRIEPESAEMMSKKEIIDLINQLKRELSYRD